MANTKIFFAARAIVKCWPATGP